MERKQFVKFIRRVHGMMNEIPAQISKHENAEGEI